MHAGEETPPDDRTARDRDYPFGFDQRMRFLCINAPRLAECALQRMSPY